jgi:hypothetical protein
MMRPVNPHFDAWKDAVEAGDTFRFARVTGDRDLIRRIWRRLRDMGADPLGIDMLALKDLELGINGLVEKARNSTSWKPFSAIRASLTAA